MEEKSADFPDALIVNKAKHQVQQWHQAFKGVYTFDVAAWEIPALSPLFDNRSA